MSGNYEVGYQKPPKRTQFKKGQSGNPQGRRRKVRFHKATEELRREFMVAIEQEVTVNHNGRKRKMPAIKALYDQILAKALGGDFRSMKMLCEMYRTCVTEDEDQRMRLLEIVLDIEKAREEEILAELDRMTPEERERMAETEMKKMAWREALRKRNVV
jgi:hypothetical protein